MPRSEIGYILNGREICKDVLKTKLVNLFGILWDIGVNTENLLEHFKGWKKVVLIDISYSCFQGHS